MKKYNFELILSDEVMKANRLRMIQDEKEKKEKNIMTIIAIVGLLLMILLLINDNKNYEEEDLSKCENGIIQIMTAREYDNQVETFCK